MIYLIFMIFIFLQCKMHISRFRVKTGFCKNLRNFLFHHIQKLIAFSCCFLQKCDDIWNTSPLSRKISLENCRQKIIFVIKLHYKNLFKNQNIKIIKNDLNQEVKINDLNHLANPALV